LRHTDDASVVGRAVGVGVKQAAIAGPDAIAVCTIASTICLRADRPRCHFSAHPLRQCSAPRWWQPGFTGVVICPESAGRPGDRWRRRPCAACRRSGSKTRVVIAPCGAAGMCRRSACSKGSSPDRTWGSSQFQRSSMTCGKVRPPAVGLEAHEKRAKAFNDKCGGGENG
jgi:hypothetical protein